MSDKKTDRQRLDQALVNRGLVPTRSQAENYIKLGKVKVDGIVVSKPGRLVAPVARIGLVTEQYVSRAAFKLVSITDRLKLEFKDKTVLDVGSSTGGFTDFVLRQGATKVIAVDAGTDQLHPSLRSNDKIELHEKTDIRELKELSVKPDVVLIDVSFITLRVVLPAISRLAGSDVLIVAMFKPQFETGDKDTHKGVVKNDRLRRRVIKDFEDWLRGKYLTVAKADSEVQGSKGNLERFYLLKKHL